MKNLALALFSAIFVAACSSGNTISDLPQNVTSSFQGSFTDGPTSGSITLNLSDDNAGTVTGTLIVTGNTCLQSASFTGGVSNGFSLTLSGIPQTGPDSPDTFEVVTTTTAADGAVTMTTVIQSSGTPGTQTQTLADGTTIVTVTTLMEGEAGEVGTLGFQLAITNGGSTLSGTFISEGAGCPAGQGAGSITLNGG